MGRNDGRLPKSLLYTTLLDFSDGLKTVAETFFYLPLESILASEFLICERLWIGIRFTRLGYEL